MNIVTMLTRDTYLPTVHTGLPADLLALEVKGVVGCSSVGRATPAPGSASRSYAL